MRTKNVARLLLVLTGVLAASAADPLMGRWNVIPESVKFPGGGGPKNIVLKYEAGAGDEVKFTLTGELNALPYSYSWTAKPDGRKYPVSGQTRAKEIELQRPAPNHAITIHYADGKEIARHDATISADGTSMTTKSRSVNPEGHQTEASSQYRKQ